MKRLLVSLLVLLSGCATVQNPRADQSMLCALEMNGKCLQWNRFQALYSVQQDRTKP